MKSYRKVKVSLSSLAEVELLRFKQSLMHKSEVISMKPAYIS